MRSLEQLEASSNHRGNRIEYLILSFDSTGVSKFEEMSELLGIPERTDIVCLALLFLLDSIRADSTLAERLKTQFAEAHD